MSIKFRNEITMRPIEAVMPYYRNAKLHDEEQIKKIAAQIATVGWDQPIVVDTQGIIIKGHGRLAAAKSLGLTEVPVIVSDVSEKEARLARIADNKVAESGWDNDMLALELADLKALGESLDLSAFESKEIDEVLNEYDRKTNPRNEIEDEVPEVKETTVKLGDLYQLGNHRLLCGDSTKKYDVERLIGGESPELMFTDPPYGVKLDQSWRDDALGERALGKGNKNIIKSDDRFDWSDAYSLFKGDVAYVWCPSRFYHEFHKNLESCDLIPTQMIVWNKSVMVMGRSDYHWKHEPCIYSIRKNKNHLWSGDRKQTTVWDAPSPNHIMSGSKDDKTEHPSQKPVILAETAILNHSIKSVYDPFLGSGSTLIACEKTNRKCFGMEIDPQYCQVIIDRWEKYSGQKAVLIDTSQPFEMTSDSAEMLLETSLEPALLS